MCAAVPILFVARALNIFPLSLVTNSLRSRRAGRAGGYTKSPIGWRMQVVMWFSGMRGALSFALALSELRARPPAAAVCVYLRTAAPLKLCSALPLPAETRPIASQPAALDDNRYPHSLAPSIYHLLLSATLFTIVVTTLLMAPATRPLIQCLRPGQTPRGITHASFGKSLSASLLSDTPADAGGSPRSYGASSLNARMMTPSPPPRRGVPDREQPGTAMPPAPLPTLSSFEVHLGRQLEERGGGGHAAPAPGSPMVLSTDEDEGMDEVRPPACPPIVASSPGLHNLYRSFRRFELEHIKPIFGGRTPGMTPGSRPGSASGL